MVFDFHSNLHTLIWQTVRTITKAEETENLADVKKKYEAASKVNIT